METHPDTSRNRGEHEAPRLSQVTPARHVRNRRRPAEAADVTGKVRSPDARCGFPAPLLGPVAAWFDERAGAVEPIVTAHLALTRRPLS